MEGAHGHVARDCRAEAPVHPLFHLRPCVSREGQQKQFGRLAIPLSDEPRCLGNDDRRLSAARRGDHQVAAFVDHDRPALLVCERAGLDPVEEVARADQLVDDERLVGLGPGNARRFKKLQDVPQHLEFGSIRQRSRPARRESAGNGLRLGLKVAKRVGGEVSGRVGQCRQPIVHGSDRFKLRGKHTAPPLASRGFQRIGQGTRIRPGQARYMRGPRAMADPNAGIEPTACYINSLHVAQRYVGGPQTEDQPDRFGVHRCRPGMARMPDREENSGQPGSPGLEREAGIGRRVRLQWGMLNPGRDRKC